MQLFNFQSPTITMNLKRANIMRLAIVSILKVFSIFCCFVVIDVKYTSIRVFLYSSNARMCTKIQTRKKLDTNNESEK